MKSSSQPPRSTPTMHSSFVPLSKTNRAVLAKNGITHTVTAATGPVRRKTTPHSVATNLNAINRNYMRPSSSWGGRAGACVSPFCPDPNCIDENNELPPELLCSVIESNSPVSADSWDSDDSERIVIDGSTMYNRQQNDGEGAVFFELQKPGTARQSMTAAAALQQQQQQQQEGIPSPTTWKDNVLQVSNYASAFCVLDCTILPLVTLLLPLLSSSGLLAGSNIGASAEWLHELGHSVALWFVLPVGGLATVSGYLFSHRKIWIGLLGCLGLMLIGTANAGCHAVHHHSFIYALLPSVIQSILHQFMHTLHHGLAHRIANLSGCALLMGSNYLSKRYGGACRDPNCAC